MNDTLGQLTDAELSECFAVTMGVPCDPDDYATSADAVLPWLEKRHPDCHGSHGSWLIEVWQEGPFENNWGKCGSVPYAKANAPTFPRAACIALIRAKRASKEAAL